MFVPNSMDLHGALCSVLIFCFWPLGSSSCCECCADNEFDMILMWYVVPAVIVNERLNATSLSF